MTAPLLRIRGLTVRFSSGPAVLDGLDLDIGAGECLALVGESGCGKTTLARAILGLLPRPATVTGTVELLGNDIGHAPAKSRVVVRENQTGELQVHYRGQRLPFRELQKSSPRRSGKRGAAPSPAPSSPKLTTRRSVVPAAHHPWKRSYLQMRTPIDASAWS